MITPRMERIMNAAQRNYLTARIQTLGNEAKRLAKFVKALASL